jgi:hypothetical protein
MDWDVFFSFEHGSPLPDSLKKLVIVQEGGFTSIDLVLIWILHTSRPVTVHVNFLDDPSTAPAHQSVVLSTEEENQWKQKRKIVLPIQHMDPLMDSNPVQHLEHQVTLCPPPSSLLRVTLTLICLSLYTVTFLRSTCCSHCTIFPFR